MAKAVPIVAAVAGSALTGGLATPLTLGAFGAGIGSFGAAITFGTIASSAFGYLASSAINQLGSRLLSKKPKAADFSQQGQAVNIRSAIESHKVIYGQTRVWGNLVYATTTNSGASMAGGASDNKLMHMVIVLASHEVEEIGQIYFNDLPVSLDGDGFVTTSPYMTGGLKYALVKKHLGATDQLADSMMVGNLADWSDEHRLRGRAYLYVRFEYNQSAFPLGLPQVSAVVKGRKVYDPRSATTAWTDNVALCVRDYLLTYCKVPSSRIEDTYTNAAANICDEDVTLSDGTTQNRYTCNGVVDTAVSRRENLNALTASMAGAVVRVGAYVRIFAGAYDASVGTIDDDMLAGKINMRGSTPRADLINTVRGTYTDPNKGYQATDFPIVQSSTYLTQDNSVEYTKDLQLPFTNHPEAAQRIAKIIMNKARQGITVTVPLKHHAITFACWDVVSFTQDYLGFASKTFRVVKYSMSSVPNGAIEMELQEETSSIYSWTASDATVNDDPPDTTLPNPLYVAPPGNPDITEQLYVTTDGSGVKAKAILTWGASTSAFLRDYQVEYLYEGSDNRVVAGRTTETRFEVFDLAPGSYTFYVKALSVLGVSSEYGSSTKVLNGLTAPPANLQNFSLNAINNNAHLSWDQATDIDVLVGGSIRVRYTPATSGASWSSGVDIGPALAGNATQAVLPLLAGTYMIKAVDSAGNESTDVATVISTVANIVNMNTVATLTESPTFSGSKLNLLVVGSSLFDSDELFDSSDMFDDGTGGAVMRLHSDEFFDDETFTPMFDSDTELFDAGPDLGYKDAAIYSFSSQLDLGKVVTSRVTASIAATVYDGVSLFDSSEMFDSASMIDGDNATAIACDLHIRTTNDDPASPSATWTEYQRFFVGDYTCRGYQFRLIVTSSNKSYNVDISQLSVTVDMPDVVDRGSLTTSASGATAVTFGRTFYITPSIGATIKNGVSGDYFEITSASATSFNIGVKNSAGSYVARDVDWISRGY